MQATRASAVDGRARLVDGIGRSLLGGGRGVELVLGGVPLGLGCYLLFKAACGGGFPPPLAIALVAIAAVAIAAAAGAAPAVLTQRVPASVALATE